MKKISRIGIGGPVGSGKTAIIEAITPKLLEMGVKTLSTSAARSKALWSRSAFSESRLEHVLTPPSAKIPA